ncbi:MAG: type II toxin-antitoxin system VapC family toxin [Sulfuricella sp.]
MGRKRQPRLTFLDTHIVCWLFEARLDLLSKEGLAAIETGLLRVSPMVSLELQYLHEIGRITRTANDVLTALAGDIDLRMSETSFADIVERAQSLDWTRDPFDRLIVAETIVADGVLVTRDEKIRAHAPCAVW